MIEQRFKSAFDAIADTPQEAMNMKLRAQLMDKIRDRVEAEGWNQTQAAKHLGVTQPRISDLYRDKLSQFSLDMLVNMLAALGDEVELTIKVA